MAKEKAKKVELQGLNRDAKNINSELNEEDLESVAGGTKSSPAPKKGTPNPKTGLFEIEDFSFDIEQTSR